MNGNSAYGIWGLLAAALWILSPVAMAQSAEKEVCVTASRANLRVGPGTDHRISWEVGQFMPLIQVDEQGEWIKVKDLDGDIHWVFGSLVSDDLKCVTVKAPKANIRDQPTTASKMRDTVEQYTSFKRMGANEKWVQIEFGAARRGGKSSAWIYHSLVWPF